jgi:tetratricopeptide (TPR) repeat protein
MFEDILMINKALLSACICAGLMTQPVFAEDAVDPETLFNEGMQYRKDGELFKSIEIFETILSNQPGLNRARLELAVSYHLTRRYEDAKEQLTAVLNDPETPVEVRLSITAYLAQLSGDIANAAQRSSSSLYLSVGGFTDSNINLGPGKDITGITPESLENSGSGGQFMFTYAHRSRASQAMHINGAIVDFEWLTQATAYSKVYASGDTDFNLSVLTLNTGPALIAEQSWRAAFNFKLDKLFFGNEDYAEYVGINPLFTYSIMKDLEITFENITTAREYDKPENQGLRGTMTMWGVDLAKFYAKQSIGLQAGVKYHDNGAKAGSLHFTGTELYFGGQIPAWKNAQAYLTLSSRDYRYKSPDGSISSTVRRDERENLAVLGVSHDFRNGFFKSWTLNAQYTYTKNDSNLNAFTYDRNIIELNMRRYFF